MNDPFLFSYRHPSKSFTLSDPFLLPVSKMPRGRLKNSWWSSQESKIPSGHLITSFRSSKQLLLVSQIPDNPSGRPKSTRKRGNHKIADMNSLNKVVSSELFVYVRSTCNEPQSPIADTDIPTYLYQHRYYGHYPGPPLPVESRRM